MYSLVGQLVTHFSWADLSSLVPEVAPPFSASGRVFLVILRWKTFTPGGPASTFPASPFPFLLLSLREVPLPPNVPYVESINFFLPSPYYHILFFAPPLGRRNFRSVPKSTITGPPPSSVFSPMPTTNYSPFALVRYPAMRFYFE